MSLSAKKEIQPQSPSESEDQDGEALLERVLEESKKQLDEILKTFPPEKVAEAKAEVEAIFSGDTSWADLSQYTPERILQIAEIGYSKFNVGHYDSAQKLFRGLVVLEPQNYYFHQMLGAIYQRKNMLPEAFREYSLAIQQNPNDTASITNRGEVLFKLSFFDEALADFEKAISLDAKNEDKWVNRARVLREQVKLVKTKK